MVAAQEQVRHLAEGGFGVRPAAGGGQVLEGYGAFAGGGLAGPFASAGLFDELGDGGEFIGVGWLGALLEQGDLLAGCRF